MLLLNFAHPLTPLQQGQIETMIVQPITQIITQAVQLDEQQPLAPQLQRLVAGLGVSAADWQTRPLLVILPGYAPAAAGLLAAIHGRRGHFPTIVHIRRQAGSVPTVYEAGEIIDLQAVRTTARNER